ncbi:PAS domain S-box protein [bacterium]|nr:PAS domain S-box protein [bacterium]
MSGDRLSQQPAGDKLLENYPRAFSLPRRWQFQPGKGISGWWGGLYYPALQEEEFFARLEHQLAIRRQQDTIHQNAKQLQQAQEALRLSEDRFTAAFRASPESYAIMTLAEGRFVDVNGSFCAMTGYSQEELVGRRDTDIRLWVDEAEHVDILQSLQDREEVRDREINFYTKSRQIRTVLFSAEMIQWGGGNMSVLFAQGHHSPQAGGGGTANCQPPTSPPRHH